MPTVRYTTVGGEIIAEKRNGVRRLYVPDPLGSTVALLDNTQAQTDTFSYWPFGEEKTRSGTTPTPFRFGGTQGAYQDGSGAIYGSARYLDPKRGRWANSAGALYRTAETNPYIYARNSPASLLELAEPWELLARSRAEPCRSPIQCF